MLSFPNYFIQIRFFLAKKSHHAHAHVTFVSLQIWCARHTYWNESSANSIEQTNEYLLWCRIWPKNTVRISHIFLFLLRYVSKIGTMMELIDNISVISNGIGEITWNCKHMRVISEIGFSAQFRIAVYHP